MKKSFEITAESYNQVANSMKETREARNIWKQKFCSLSRLMRTAQTKEGLEIVKPIFEAFNIPTTGKVKPSEIEQKFKVWTETKKNGNIPAYISRKAKRDEAGEIVKDDKGNVIYEYVKTAVRPNNWTLDNLVKVLASSL